MRFFMLLVLAGFVLPVSCFAFDPVGTAVADGVSATLVRRGFLSTDPRVLQTLTSMGVRTSANATAVGTGASWLGVVGRIAPYATGAVLVYEGVNWWFDNQGKAYLAQPGSVSTSPIFSNGIKPGGTVYYLSNQSQVLAGSLQEAYAYLTFKGRQSYNDASYGVPLTPSVKIVVASSIWSSNLPWGDGFDDDEIHQREERARAQPNERTAQQACG